MKTIFDKTFWVGLILILALATQGIAQVNLVKAREYKANMDYSDAVVYYEKHFDAHPAAINDARDLADCYLLMNETKAAGEWYEKVLGYDASTAKDVLTYANLLKTQGKYDEAIQQFERYASINPNDADKAGRWADQCRLAKEWIADPVYYDVVNAREFNSEKSDFGLIPFGDKFLIASDRELGEKAYKGSDIYGWTGNPYLKILAVDADHGDLLSIPDGLNNDYHNGPGVYDAANKQLLFTRTKMVKVKKEPVNSDPTSWYDLSESYEYVMRLEIYSATFMQGKWIGLAPFAYNSSDEYSVGHPALSPDGKILYFVSDMPGGYGQADIYYCERQLDGSWSKPVNAGPNINTPGKEVFPFMDKNGVLFFSSDGHPGMGGLDLFSADGSKGRWNPVENLRYPFNSPADDFSIYADSDKKSGYLASNRPGGEGSDDIYAFTFAPPTILTLAVRTLQRLDDGSLIPLGDVNVYATLENADRSSMRTNNKGLTFSEADCMTDYLISGSKEGYYANSVQVETPPCQTRNDTVFAELVFDKIIINKPIAIENIYYDFDKWNIRPDAAVELDKIVKVLTDNPFISIELGSHTDSRGTAAYNEALSQKRAESAVAYIVSRGIDASRITAKGYGESVPINDCVDGTSCDEESYQMNRRTEFMVTKIK